MSESEHEKILTGVYRIQEEIESAIARVRLLEKQAVMYRDQRNARLRQYSELRDAVRVVIAHSGVTVRASAIPGWNRLRELVEEGDDAVRGPREEETGS